MTTESGLFTANQQYTAWSSIWKKCRDCTQGEDALHAADKDKQGTYLRPLNPSNTSAENVARNNAYIEMARYQNFVGSTVSGFLGMAYREKPVTPELPERMRYLMDNINGVGSDIEQHSRRTLDNVIQVSRHGLLTEMPANDGEITVADEQAGMRPYIASYSAESIYDWYPDCPTADEPLQYVVLVESKRRRKESNEFQTEEVKVWRLLYLDEDGNYWQEIFEPDGNGNYPQAGSGDATQIFAAGRQPMKHIPFTFVGGVENDPSVDKPLILDIANASIGMYQEDANLRISSFGFSAGTLAISDDRLASSANDPNDKSGGVQMGDGMAIVMGTSGKAEIIVPPSNPLAATIKAEDQKNMAELGAQVIMPTSGVTSIAEVKSKEAVNSSKLTVGVENVSAAYNEQLGYCAEFLGESLEFGEDNPGYAINTDFFGADLTPEQITAIVSSWQSGFISKSVAQRIAQDKNYIPGDVNLAQMNDEIDQEPSGNLDLDNQDDDE